MPVSEILKTKMLSNPAELVESDFTETSINEAFCFAAQEGYDQAFIRMMQLVPKKILKDIISQDNHRAFHLAADNGHIEILKLIFELIISLSPTDYATLNSLIEYSNNVAILRGYLDVLLYNIHTAEEEKQIKMIKTYGYKILLLVRIEEREAKKGKRQKAIMRALLGLVPEDNHNEIIDTLLSEAIAEQDLVTLRLLLKLASYSCKTKIIADHAYEIIKLDSLSKLGSATIINNLFNITSEEHYLVLVESLFSSALQNRDLEVLALLVESSLSHDFFTTNRIGYSNLADIRNRPIVILKHVLQASPSHCHEEIIAAFLPFAIKEQNPALLEFLLEAAPDNRKVGALKTYGYGMLRLYDNNNERSAALRWLLNLGPEGRHIDIIDTLFRSTWAKQDSEILEFLLEAVPEAYLSESSKIIAEKMLLPPLTIRDRFPQEGYNSYSQNEIQILANILSSPQVTPPILPLPISASPQTPQPSPSSPTGLELAQQILCCRCN